MVGFDFPKTGKLTPRFQMHVLPRKRGYTGLAVGIGVCVRSTAVEPAGSAPPRSWTLLRWILRLEGIIMFMYSASLINMDVIE